MSIGTRLQAMASRLIYKHGDLVTISYNPGAPKNDVTKPWRGSSGSETVDVKAIQYPYEEEEKRGSTVRHGSSRFIIAENDADKLSQFGVVELETAVDLTEANGNVWSIEAVEIIEPGPERILYLVEVER